MQRFYRVLGLPAQRIVDTDDRRQLPVDAEIQMGICGGQRVIFLLLSLRDMAALVLKDKVGTADDDLFIFHHTGNTVGHHILHLRMVFLMGKAPPLRLLHHGVGHGVGVMLLQAGGEAEHIRFPVSAEGNNLRHLRRGVGQRTGLVEHNGIRLGHSLQKTPALDGNVMPAAFPHGRQHRDRDRQLQRAGEVHHQNGQHLGHIAGQQIGHSRAAQRIGNQPVRHAGRLVLSGGFQLFRFLDHADHPVIASAAGYLFHADHALAFLGHRTGINRAAGPLGHRHGFSGERGLVHHGLALYHPAIQRDHAAGADHDAIPRLHVGDLRQHLGAVYLLPDVFYP